MATRSRPLSPHLQIYRPQLTSLLSIIHRATGVGLCAGAVALVWGIVAVAAGGNWYADFGAFAASLPGRLLTAVFVFCLVYHWLNGLRHLTWDVGWGLNIGQAYQTGWVVVVLAPALTLLALWGLWG